MSEPSFLPCHPDEHHQCIDQALERAIQLCRDRGVRLTEIRRRVLELIWQSHKPRGAYDLLEELSKEGHNSAPPTVYRALDFLLEQGLIHRIASLNAFIGCNQPDEYHRSGFLICRQCGHTLELNLDSLGQAVHQEADRCQFEINHLLVEASGLCAACRNGEEAVHPAPVNTGD